MKTLAASLLVLALPAAVWGAEYRYNTVDFAGAANTALYAINDLGHYVGAEKDASGAHHAVFNDGTQLALLDPTGLIGTSAESWAYSISHRGDIAGAYIDATGASHGYLRHATGKVDTLDYPGGFDTQAYGVNDHGTVIGAYNDAAGNTHAFVLRNGHYKPADLAGGILTVPLSINDWEQIAGEYITTPGTAGYGYVQFRSGRYTLHTAPGSQPQQTFFISINNFREVLGAYEDAAGKQQNFIRKGSTYLPFDLPSSFAASFVSAQTINDREDIVGYYLDASSVAHGFVAKAIHPEE